ncbi:MAG: outer membrane protein transport protein, partial [Thermoanaerobaculaceae bacterium]|nr:outer membrane protein transport protein [Thermoanaerobaculaceae bacterium]
APGRYFPIAAETELDIVNYGISAALRVSQSFSLGLGVSYYDLSLDSLTRRYNITAGTGFAPGEYFGPPDFADSNIRSTVSEQGDDSAIGVSLGLLFRATDSLSIGAVYRQGPKFDCTSTASRLSPAGEATVVETVLHVPDVIGIGASYRLSDRATLSFDYDFVRYSQLTDEIKDAYGRTDQDLENYVVDDGNELHLGFEFLFLTQKVVIPVRLGVWHDPDHKIRYEGEVEAERARFGGGDDQVHYTAGVGVAVGTPFELNIAYDHSDTVKTASLSAVIRFK